MLGAHTNARAFATALVVEDDDELRRALVRGLRAWGIDTLEAADVKSAQRLLRREPDLVVTDVRLPDGTGHEVARQAARMRTLPFIVAMSGEATVSEAFELGRASVRLYLEKPFTVAELQARIERSRAHDHDAARERWDAALPSELRAAMLEALERLTVERGLTGREHEVLRLTLAGVARSDLPRALGVSPNTCKSLVRSTLRKCGMRRLTQVLSTVCAQLDEREPA